MWMKENGFKDLLRSWWMGFQFGGSFNFTLFEKLKALKASLKIWNREVFGNIIARKELAIKHMVLWDSVEGDRVLSTEEQNLIKQALEEYKKWVIMEETFWRQNFIELWLREGDINTDKWRPKCNGLQVGVLEGEDAAMLETPFSEEEVFGALSDLNGDKVPSLDGGIEDLKGFRPISLVGILYKLLAKVLANRLKKVMGKIVSKSQNTFVEGRQILDASLIANEAIDSMQKSESGDIFCKLDIGKVYDHVNWSFLFGCWKGWVLELSGLAGLSGVLVLSVSPSLLIKLPLVSSKVLGLETEGSFIPLHFCDCHGGVEITHLLFADDTLVFCEPFIDQVCYLSWLLMWFEAMLGLKVNLDKSEIISAGRVENVEDLALEFGCKVSMLSSSYLGLPLGVRKEVAVWDEVEVLPRVWFVLPYQ
ncbi:hypothetical protein CK203_043023 [Vitis vinifera]|uniref:Reverse transcriptase domain-containing protein n=1 Tax=Vitis vinifera TaxID=29760 RepID=A0A438GZF8_VITVI|nr:hypothetical protein CK203_043023 [Vitis vinifera]